MVGGRVLFWLGLLGGMAGIGVALSQRTTVEFVLPTGKRITPPTQATQTGSFPLNMTLSPDGKFVLVTDCGFREQLSVLDSQTGALVSKLEFNGSEDGHKQGLYFGLATHAFSNGVTKVAVSRGSEDRISLYDLDASGKLTHESDIDLPVAQNPLKIPNHVAGLAWSADGSKLYAVGNQSHVFNGFRGNLFSFDSTSHELADRAAVGSFPLDVRATPSGVFVANEGGSEVSVAGGAPIPVGQAPTYLALDHSGRRLFVSNSDSDNVSIIGLPSKAVEATVLLRPAGLRGLPGATPLGMAISPDDRTLYVAMADLNAIAVVDVQAGRLEGYIPAGWYPTSLACTLDGKRLFVADAKGTKAQNPNSHDVRGWGQYIQNILEGSVSMIDLPAASAELPALTRQVLENNRPLITPAKREAAKPRIKHLIYVIKENRTYDQVLGDLGEGNGDSSLTLFGRGVTPNQHALAKRFGLYDNFYVCAEVSADGWNWSTAGLASAYTERNTTYNYSDRGRGYDFEGTNNGSPISLESRRDVAEPAGGYLWDAFLGRGLSVRNYGMFLTFGVDTKGPDGQPISLDNGPSKPNLAKCTCLDYRKFDLEFPDSDAWSKLGIPSAGRQRKSYGSHGDSSRIETWRREFERYVKDGNLPALSLLRLPRNHTAGTSAGASSARAMVADNDYAVGELADAVSHSPFWKDTAIFVVEDDDQDGFDHVDCHRSPVLVISPYTEPGAVHHEFYNTDSVLATMEWLMGVPVQNEYLAVAKRIEFSSKPANSEPYTAMVPEKAILSEINSRSAYRAADSARLFAGFDEESEPDMELNEILWRSIKGVKAPLPRTPGVMWGVKSFSR